MGYQMGYAVVGPGSDYGIARITLQAPNLHNIPMNIVAPNDWTGKANRDTFGKPHVFVATSEPHGIIEVTLKPIAARIFEKKDFVAKFSDVYVGATWVMKEAVAKLPDHISEWRSVLATCRQVVAEAGFSRQMELLATCPKEAQVEGGPECSPDDPELSKLLSEYQQKFCFPFILAAEGYTRGR